MALQRIFINNWKSAKSQKQIEYEELVCLRSRKVIVSDKIKRINQLKTKIQSNFADGRCFYNKVIKEKICCML